MMLNKILIWWFWVDVTTKTQKIDKVFLQIIFYICRALKSQNQVIFSTVVWFRVILKLGFRYMNVKNGSEKCMGCRIPSQPSYPHPPIKNNEKYFFRKQMCWPILIDGKWFKEQVIGFKTFKHFYGSIDETVKIFWGILGMLWRFKLIKPFIISLYSFAFLFFPCVCQKSFSKTTFVISLFISLPLLCIYRSVVFCFLFLFFLLVSHLRLIQRIDETVVGWLNHFIVITL